MGPRLRRGTRLQRSRLIHRLRHSGSRRSERWAAAPAHHRRARPRANRRNRVRSVDPPRPCPRRLAPDRCAPASRSTPTAALDRARHAARGSRQEDLARARNQSRGGCAMSVPASIRALTQLLRQDRPLGYRRRRVAPSCQRAPARTAGDERLPSERMNEITRVELSAPAASMAAPADFYCADHWHRLPATRPEPRRRSSRSGDRRTRR